MKARNRTMQRGLDQQAIEGIRSDLQGMPALYLGGKVFTPATLEQFIQARIDAANGILAAKAAWLDATKQYAALDMETSQVMRDLKRLVIGAFGEQSPKLADFGFKPTAAEPWTPEKTALAVARRAATRVARKTMGPKARLTILGAAPAAAPATPDVPDVPDDAKE